MASKQSGGSKQQGESERGQSESFANDPQHVSEAGKKGSQHSQILEAPRFLGAP